MGGDLHLDLGAIQLPGTWDLGPDVALKLTIVHHPSIYFHMHWLFRSYCGSVACAAWGSGPLTSLSSGRAGPPLISRKCRFVIHAGDTALWSVQWALLDAGLGNHLLLIATLREAVLLGFPGSGLVLRCPSAEHAACKPRRNLHVALNPGNADSTFSIVRYP